MSCSNEAPYKVHIETYFWGEDVVCNESGRDMTMTLYDTYDGELQTLSFDCPDGHIKTMDLPSMMYTVSISKSSDSLKIEFADGRSIVTTPSEDFLYGTYDLTEEVRYEDGIMIDKLWPTYTYVVTETHYDAAK